VADTGFNDWLGPLSLARPQSFGLKLGFNIMGRPACLIFNALRHPGVITPTDMVLGITFTLWGRSYGTSMTCACYSGVTVTESFGTALDPPGTTCSQPGASMPLTVMS
jgi:hypothetical protein